MTNGAPLPFQRRDLPENLGPSLRGARSATGRSRRDVAAAVGIAPRTLARIERGAQKPLWPTLDRLCDELGVSAFAVAKPWASQAMDLPTKPNVAPGLGLQALRRERGMTLVALAGLVGVSAATLSRFERGLTASRLLGRRVGGPDLSFDDRDVVLDAERLAPAFGLAGADALGRACRSAFAANAVRAG